jgi:tetratricopeptide (TPR) repeat protein
MLILASVSVSLMGCRDPVVPTSGPARADDARAYYDRGNAWATKQCYGNAIADYSVAIRLDPRFAVAYSERGDAWPGMQEYIKVVADYREGVRLDPVEAFPYTGLTWIWATNPDAKYRIFGSTVPVTQVTSQRDPFWDRWPV